MANSTSGKLGVSYTTTSTTAAFAVGTLDEGTDGTKWMYVSAASAIAQYDAVGITEDKAAAPLTKAMADDNYTVGFAQVAIASGSYGWVALSGSNINCNLAASCAADVALYTTGTAGTLDDSSTSQTKVEGVCAVTAVNTAAAVEVLANSPKTF